MSKLNLIVEPGKQEIHYTYVFDAPRELVFKYFTDPDLIPKWWGPEYLSTTVERLEPHKGGVWRYVQNAPDGSQYGFNGVFHLVEAPERIIQTFEWEGMPGHVQLETLVLEERDGRTYAAGQSVFQSLEDRDGMVASGMEAGMAEGFVRFDLLLAQAAQAG